ncbi:MAG: cobalamin B12-binding domain-containing protein [Candidatus Nanopelagicales bacterium]|nr:cobalamin B12-binding domain-containing protein [Candidatus Nanopelagicales bacterium]
MNTLGASHHTPSPPAVPAAERAGAGPDQAATADAPPIVALSVAGAAQGLGVAPGTLRSWERRYGLAPSLHTPGGHRRYGPIDLARLAVMHRLVQEGVPPAEAARVAIHTPISAEAADLANPYSVLLAGVPGAAPGTAAAQVDALMDPEPSASASPGGGRVLPLPRSPRSARGLARAAMALDSHSCHRTISASLAERGTIPTWEDLIRPVLVAVGERWEQSNRGVEIEHSFSAVVLGALSAHSARLERPRNGRPVVLAGAADDLHDLPLAVLRAALADVGIRSHMVGARTPGDALREAVERLGAPVVFLWAQMPGAQVPDLRVRRPATTLLVGGPGWSTTPEGVEHVGDLEHAVGAVRTAMGL